MIQAKLAVGALNDYLFRVIFGIMAALMLITLTFGGWPNAATFYLGGAELLAREPQSVGDHIVYL